MRSGFRIIGFIFLIIAIIDAFRHESGQVGAFTALGIVFIVLSIADLRKDPNGPSRPRE